ncbi:hypothetical protein D3C86_1225880 [compost metagenome]
MSVLPAVLQAQAPAVHLPTKNPWAEPWEPQGVRPRSRLPPRRAAHPSHPHPARHPLLPAKHRPALQRLLPPVATTMAPRPYRRKARHREEAVRPLAHLLRRELHPSLRPGPGHRPSPSPVRKPGPCRQCHALRRRSAPLRRRRFHCRAQTRHPLAAALPLRPCPCRTKRLF